MTYVSTSASRKEELLKEAEKSRTSIPAFYEVVEASSWEKFKLIKQFLKLTGILIKIRPHVIISTGASCGFFALKIGKILGARTIWLDSLANADELSLSGKMVANCADLWLTQWEHLVETNNENTSLRYKGRVI